MSNQSASQVGHHNVIVQNHGDNVCVRLGLPHLRLVSAEARVQKSIRSDIDILNPAFQSVPLIGRERDLQFLHNWLTVDKRIAIAALVGNGGSGKSRLALEFLQQLPSEWQGGLLTSDEAKRFVSQENLSEWSWQQPTLIIADYAAMMSETLSRWFSALADHIAPAHVLRILLLERHANTDSGWYQSLTDATWQGQRTRELFWPSVPRQLSRLDSAVNRREVLQAGLNAAATIAPAHPIALMPPYGEDKLFDQRLRAVHWGDPLLLLMAGIIARTDGFNAALSLSRPELAKQLALRERDRIRKSVGGQVAKDLITHVYACVTLCGGLPYDEAIQVSAAEFSALHREYPGGAGQAVEDLAKVIGSRDSLPALVPDLLGEAYLIVTLGSMGPDVTMRLSHIASAQVTACLARCTQDFAPHGESWRLEWLMSSIVAGLNKPEILLNIAFTLPPHSLALGESAVLATSMLVRFCDVCIRRSGVPSSSELAMLADLLDMLSVRQHEVGRRSDSLASAQESVRIWRSLADANVNSYLPKLARALTNLAHSQGIVGHRIEALSCISEAVKIDRVLSENTPGANLSALSTSLGSQSLRYSETGQFQEALSAITESVTIRRALANSDPEEFLPDLAMALNTQASHLRSLNRDTEALASTTEAVSIHRSLVEANPDAHLVEFARSLNSHGAILAALGRYSEALEFVTQAVDIRQSLVEGNPDAFLPDLGRSLHNVGLILSKMGKRKEAVTLFAEAARCYRNSIETNNDPTLPWLTKALQSLAKEQLSLEQHPEALATVGEATRLLRPLANEYPELFLPQLAELLVEQASIQRGMHLHSESLASYSEIVGIYRRLVKANPNESLPELANALCEQASIQNLTGLHSKAVPVISEAVQIYRDLGAIEPGNSFQISRMGSTS